MTDLLSNFGRRDTQNFALLSANFRPAYAEEHCYSFSIKISKNPDCSGTQQNTVGFNGTMARSAVPNRRGSLGGKFELNSCLK